MKRRRDTRVGRVSFVEVAFVLVTVGLIVLSADGLAQKKGGGQSGLLPDLETVVPKHLQAKKERGEVILRFTNGIANRGAGHFRLRPDPFPEETPVDTVTTDAIQEILGENCTDPDACKLLVPVEEALVSTFEFHPTHNHWHVADATLFEVREALDDGTEGDWGDVVGQASIKVTFCIIDWYKLDDNAPTSERVYFDCAVDYQGIQPGWVDQYHHSLEGQNVVITGAPEGIYYLVSTANPESIFIEEDYTNNTAWVSFELYYTGGGKPKIMEIDHSPCDTPGMCGEQGVNR